MNHPRFTALLLAAASSTSCAPNAYEQNASLATEAERACVDDSECDVVDMYCGCQPNGAVAVNRESVEEVLARRPELCANGGPDPPLSDNCGATIAACSLHTCVLVR